MITSNRIFLEDIDSVVSCADIPWEKLSNKTVFITGGTGLIGTTIVNALIVANKKYNLHLNVYVLVRNRNKAESRFIFSDSIKLIIGEIEHIPVLNTKIDYIIHAACPTSSRYFVEKPVETIQTMLCGTRNVLDLATDNNLDGLIFLSSMEVYGFPQKGSKVTENDIGSFNVTDVRNSYPISKIMSENMVMAYFLEYNVPSFIIRLSQTFGPGIDYNDNRVFAEFARCAIEHKDIVLKTNGDTERSYLYTSDAAIGILTVMLKGTKGSIYNLTNNNTYCSILEMAKMVASIGNINVRIEPQDIVKFGYAKVLYMDLDTSKVKKLGWHPDVLLSEMYERLILSMVH